MHILRIMKFIERYHSRLCLKQKIEWCNENEKAGKNPKEGDSDFFSWIRGLNVGSLFGEMFPCLRLETLKPVNSETSIAEIVLIEKKNRKLNKKNYLLKNQYFRTP